MFNHPGTRSLLSKCDGKYICGGFHSPCIGVHIKVEALLEHSQDQYQSPSSPGWRRGRRKQVEIVANT